MSPLTQSAPLGSSDVESTAAVFRRLLLRAAVAAGLASSLMLWSLGALVLSVGFVVVLAMVSALVWVTQDRGQQALRAGLASARVSVQVVAGVAVVDLAGLAGALLVVICLLLSDSLRGHAERLLRLAVADLAGDRVRRR